MKILDEIAGQTLHISAKKSLVITPDEITYRYKKWWKQKQVRIKFNDITASRFGVEWLHGLKLVIGRRYLYKIRTDKEQMNISFISVYRFRLNDLNEIYIKIYEKLWECYWSRIVHQYINRLKAGQTIALAGITLSSEILTYEKNGKTVIIQADDVGVKRYQTYMTIFDKRNPGSTYLAFNYKDDWNAVVVDGLMHNLFQNPD